MRENNARSVIAARHMRTVSVLALCAVLAGCAGDVKRFSDNFYTNAVPSRPPAPVQTAFPGSSAPVYAASPQYQTAPVYGAQPQYTPPAPGALDEFSTGSVPTAPNVVSRTPLPATPQVATQVTPPPLPAPAAPTVAAQPQSQGEGWTRTGGTYITMRQGETVYNLAKRYGVPANAIMEANDIKDATSVQAGQRVLIPVYVYSRTAPASTPDADPNVVRASSSVGGRSDVPISSAPTPATRPTANVAVVSPSVAPGGRYVVQAGDTLYGISRKTGASVDAIRRTNSLTGDTLRIGQSLIVPGLTSTRSQNLASNVPLDRAVTGATPSVAPAPKPDQVAPYTPPSVSTIDRNATASAPASTGLNSLRWPARGRIVSAFGSDVGGKANDGIDISLPIGTPVKAAENGTVIYAGDGLKELGKTILVRHGDGLVTVYGHVNDLKVSRGDQVTRGQEIAASGMTGAARQPQLHFEVRKDTKPVNPTKYLN
ncbi:MAG: peptidoglycan DD-metalloendopeptidase family protein [Pseudomonadota bacterium]